MGGCNCGKTYKPSSTAVPRTEAVHGQKPAQGHTVRYRKTIFHRGVGRHTPAPAPVQPLVQDSDKV